MLQSDEEVKLYSSMQRIWDKHIFTAELPYEKDQIVTLFIKERFKKVDVFIMSLGQMSNIPASKFSSYYKNELVSERTYIKNNLKAGGIKLYFLYIPKALFSVTFDMIRALKKINFSCDIFFAQHFLPAFIAVVLRRIGILRCKKIVFLMFDFFPIPSGYPRGFYYLGIDFIQGFIRKRVDEIWYTTPRLVEADKERFGPLPKTVIKRLTQGYFFRRIKTPLPPAPPPLRLAFLGSLRVDTAIYESIDALIECVKNGMDVELLIIGSGPEEMRIKKYVQENKIGSKVKFYGFEDRGEKIAEILSKCHLGLSLYPADPYSPNWFLTSGKFRRYVSQRLPTVVSLVPYFVKYIYDYNAGVVVDNEPKDIRKVLQKLYNNPRLIDKMRQGCDKLYSLYNADKVLEREFTDMLS